MSEKIICTKEHLKKEINRNRGLKHISYRVWVKTFLPTSEEQGFPGLTSVKVSKKDEFRLLPGYYTGSNSEDCYLGIKGKMTPVDKGVRQVIKSRLEKHSRKPTETRNRIVSLFGDLPRIELFATERISGWDAYGLDVDCDIWKDEINKTRLTIKNE